MSVLQRFFESRLTQLGYPGDELTVSYSVGFCQGDDVVVSGQLDTEHLKKLAARRCRSGTRAYERLSLRKEEKDLLPLIDFVENFADCSVEIDCKDIKAQMHVGWDLELEQVLLDMGDEFHEEREQIRSRLVYFDRLWTTFMEWIEMDIRSQCRALLRNAHDIRMAHYSEEEEHWSFETGHYRITLESSCGDEDILSDWDESIFHDTVDDLMSEKSVVRNLKATLVDLNTELELQSYTFVGCVIYQDSFQQEVKRLRNELVRELIAIYRSEQDESVARAA